MSANPHAGHRQRLRNRYLNEGGLKGFDDHLILEFLLFYCYPRENTNEIAHNMLNEYGGALNLLNAEPADIQKRCNVSERVAVLVNMIPQLASWYFAKQTEALANDTLDSVEKAGRYAVGLLTGYRNEAFYCIYLNIKNKLLSAECISKGDVAGAHISPRKIAEHAFKYNASRVVLAHNHPSADLTPSQSDKKITEHIKGTLEKLDIQVIDHIITGGGVFYSFAEHGLI